jgi:hypothetical protein
VTEEIEVPVDPEDGLAAAAVAALYTFVLTPDDVVERYERIDVLAAWADWCFEREVTTEAVVDVVVTRGRAGDLRVTAARGRARGEVVGTLSADLQRTLLDAALGDPDARVIVALACLGEILDELNLVLADDEKLYGHLALVHRTDLGTAESPADRRARHRDAHRRGESYAGHRT